MLYIKLILFKYIFDKYYFNFDLHFGNVLDIYAITRHAANCSKATLFNNTGHHPCGCHYWFCYIVTLFNTNIGHHLCKCHHWLCYIVTVLLSLATLLVITCASATIGFVVGNDNTAANDFDFHATVIDDATMKKIR